MNYLGIDWAYGRAAYCAMSEAGEIKSEGLISADQDGLARLVIDHGTEVKACVEMMSGAVWVRDQLELSGWEVQIAHARKVRDVAPLACKTDKVDARVLAELSRRDLVPALWVPSPEDRALRERLRRRAHLVKARTSHRNRIFGLLTQFGLRISLRRLRQPDALELLQARGVPAVWRDSIAHHLAEIDHLDRRIAPIDRQLAPLARSDSRAQLLQTIPGVGPLLGLTFASEIGEVSRFSSASKLVGYAGLAPRISQSGERSATGSLSKAGSRTLRWAAVEAANQAWRPTNPFHAHYLRIAARHGKNPAKSAVARKLLIACWHMLSRDQVFQLPRSNTATASSSRFLAA
ncbi:MAG TPA: IS110 family transposase [Gemmatimonadota bacterium]|nr:IS110 family transposase [Gemmatimonadota bacterium]